MKDAYQQQFGLDDDEIRCLAEGQVAMSDRLASWTATPGPTREERKAIATDYVDMHIRCTDHWKLMFVDYRMPGPHAEAVSKKSRECVANTLDNDQARFMWISEMSGEHTPDVEHPFLAALEECLTGGELDGLDLGS